MEISNALLAYDFHLKPTEHISGATCDKYIEGAFVPKDNQIVLCTNVLFDKTQY